MTFVPLQHQLEGLAWMKKTLSAPHAKGFLIADEMGSGKTLGIVMFLMNERIGNRPDLIVCPGGAVEVWTREINRAKDWPEPGRDPRICFFHGSNRDRLLDSETWDYVITTYGCLVTSLAKLQEKLWGRIVLDESHSIKNGKGVKRADAAFKIAPRAKYRICMSGTPFCNRVSDVANQAKFIGTPPYNDPAWWKINGNNPELLKRWQDEEMLRRTKDQIGLGLKPAICHTITVTPTDTEAELVESLRAKAAEQFEKWKRARGVEKIQLQAVILALIQKLRVASNTYYGGEDHEVYTAADVMTNCAKISRLVEDIDERIWEDPRQGVVVFSEFSNMTFDVLQRVLEDQLAGIEVMRYTGRESRDEKDDVVDYFNTSSHPRILLASLIAGGTAISLHHGSASVFIIEPYYHPFMEEQAAQRVHRVGQREQVHIYRYTMDHSVEVWMEGIKKRKSGLAASLALVKGDGGGGCSFADIAKLFSDFVTWTDKEKEKAKAAADLVAIENGMGQLAIKEKGKETENGKGKGKGKGKKGKKWKKGKKEGKEEGDWGRGRMLGPEPPKLKYKFRQL